MDVEESSLRAKVRQTSLNLSELQFWQKQAAGTTEIVNAQQKGTSFSLKGTHQRMKSPSLTEDLCVTLL